jgi:hypothetical protein
MQIANGVVEKSEASASVPFEAYDANRDGVLSGAEVMRGRVSFVRPLDITYKDKYQIRLSGKRVELSWVGSMNHSQDSSYIAFRDDSVLFLVDFVASPGCRTGKWITSCASSKIG